MEKPRMPAIERLRKSPEGFHVVGTQEGFKRSNGAADGVRRGEDGRAKSSKSSRPVPATTQPMVRLLMRLPCSVPMIDASSAQISVGDS